MYKKHPYRYIYVPHLFNYGRKQSEEIDNAEVNVFIIEERKDFSSKPEAKKDKPASPPHIVSLKDIVSNKSDKHLKSTRGPKGIITIHGTTVSETILSSD
jgi:hypothetical protein